MTHNSLDTVHVVLDLSALTNHPTEGLLDTDDIRQCHTSLGWGNGETGGNRKDCNDECQDDTQEVQTNTEPSLHRVSVVHQKEKKE